MLSYKDMEQLPAGTSASCRICKRIAEIRVYVLIIIALRQKFRKIIPSKINY